MAFAAIVHSYDPEEVALSGVLRKCCEMWVRVPELGRPGPVEALFQRELAKVTSPDAAKGRMRYHVIDSSFAESASGVVEERSVAATCVSFFKQIETAAGKRHILGIGGVATAPEYRRKGLGRAVVEAAFSRCRPHAGMFAEDGSCALFQTSARAFYEKLGAGVIDRTSIWNTKAGKLSFWDRFSMIWPADARAALQPSASDIIDTLGPGW